MIDYASYDVIPLHTVYKQLNAAIFTQKSIENIFKFSLVSDIFIFLQC
jgi:hypothetical protein